MLALGLAGFVALVAGIVVAFVRKTQLTYQRRPPAEITRAIR